MVTRMQCLIIGSSLKKAISKPAVAALGGLGCYAWGRPMVDSTSSCFMKTSPTSVDGHGHWWTLTATAAPSNSSQLQTYLWRFVAGRSFKIFLTPKFNFSSCKSQRSAEGNYPQLRRAHSRRRHLSRAICPLRPYGPPVDHSGPQCLCWAQR